MQVFNLIKKIVPDSDNDHSYDENKTEQPDNEC